MADDNADLPGGARLRPMEHGDYAAVMALWRETEGLTLREVDSEEAIGRYLERNPGMSFVAEANGEIVGAALCGHDGRRGYLHHMAVAPAWRGRGLGRALAGLCLRALQSEGIAKCHLFVRSENLPALSFWRHLGWLDRPDVVMLSRWSR